LELLKEVEIYIFVAEEDQGLTARQKRLAELWEELKEMNQSKR
jgi:hypothetical protein